MSLQWILKRVQDDRLGRQDDIIGRFSDDARGRGRCSQRLQKSQWSVFPHKKIFVIVCMLFVSGCNRFMCDMKSPNDMTENELQICSRILLSSRRR